MPKRIKPKPEPTLERGTLGETEAHPAANSAMDWILSIPTPELFRLVQSIELAAESKIRSAEVCAETWRRLTNGEPVSDRYLLGLCWTLRDMCDILKIPVYSPVVQGIRKMNSKKQEKKKVTRRPVAKKKKK